MPWEVTSAVDQRERFIEEVIGGCEWMSELCRKYGISRTTGYEWPERSDVSGVRSARAEPLDGIAPIGYECYRSAVVGGTSSWRLSERVWDE